MTWFGFSSSSSDDAAAKDDDDDTDDDQCTKILDDLEAGGSKSPLVPLSSLCLESDDATSSSSSSPTTTSASLNSSPSSSVSGSGGGAGASAAEEEEPESQVVSFRPLQASDRYRIQQLHEQWFPVSYSDVFYEELVTNHRLATSGDELFTCVATLNNHTSSSSSIKDTELYCQEVGEASLPQQQQQQPQEDDSDETIIGCAVGTFLHHTRLTPETAELLVPNSHEHSRLFYIMTLGTVEDYRNLGVATSLIHKCIQLVERDTSCGALYLHVIPYNHAAIRFYEKLGFYRVSTISDYYTIDGKNYDCYLYAKYYHGTYSSISHIVCFETFFFLTLNCVYLEWNGI